MEKTWEFDTTTGAGSEVVTVVYEYENDGETTYNESIKEVWFEGRNVIGLEQCDTLAAIAYLGSDRVPVTILCQTAYLLQFLGMFLQF